MTEDNAVRIKQDPAWELLAEFSASGEPDSKDQLAQRVTGAVQGLDLQPVQVERIREAIVQAVRKATRRGNYGPHHSRVFVRIWISGARIEEPSGAGADTQQDSQRKRRGWGFFVVEKQLDDPQTSAVESHHVVELYLYQERGRL